MKLIIVFVVFLGVFNPICAQEIKGNKSVIYIVDGIPFDPTKASDLGDLTEGDIFEQKIIEDRAALINLGYKKLKSLVIITTNLYKVRNKKDLSIPTTRLMTFTEESGYKKNEAKYSGKFRDYYLNGRLKSEGEIYNGRLNHTIKDYYPSGVLKSEISYLHGMKDGLSITYHLNGAINERAFYSNNEHLGIYQQFYSTGKLALELNYENPTFTNQHYNAPKSSKKQDSVSEIISKAIIEMTAYNVGKAIGMLNVAERIDSGNAQIYFYRAMALFQEKQIDSANVDFQKALKIEPLFGKVLLNMSLIQLQKYDSCVKFKNGSFFLKSGDRTDVPKSDLDNVLKNIWLAIQTGETEPVAFDVLEKYER